MNKELQSIKDLIVGKSGTSIGANQVMGEFGRGDRQLGQEEEVQAFGNFQRPRNDPYSNTYNPGLRNHPNLSWTNNNHLGANNPQGGTNFQGGNNYQGGITTKDIRIGVSIRTIIKEGQIPTPTTTTTNGVVRATTLQTTLTLKHRPINQERNP